MARFTAPPMLVVFAMSTCPQLAGARAGPRAQMQRVMREIGRGEGGASPFLHADVALVVAEASEEFLVRQVCPGDPVRPTVLARLHEEVASGHETVECTEDPAPYCTSHTGVIDPPDSDFARTWVFFARDRGGRPRIRAVYFGFYADDARALAVGRTPQRSCAIRSTRAVRRSRAGSGSSSMRRSTGVVHGRTEASAMR